MSERRTGNPLESATSANEVYILVESGVDVNARDWRGATPIFWNRSSSAVLAMLAVGADATVRDKLGSTPLHTQKKARIVRALVAAGADVNARDRDNYVALHLAWHPAAVFELLRAGADPNHRNSEGEIVESHYGSGRLASAMALMVQEVRAEGRLLRPCWRDYLPGPGRSRGKTAGPKVTQPDNWRISQH